MWWQVLVAETMMSYRDTLERMYMHMLLCTHVSGFACPVHSAHCTNTRQIDRQMDRYRVKIKETEKDSAVMCNTIRMVGIGRGISIYTNIYIYIYAMSLNRHLPCVLQFNLADHFIGFVHSIVKSGYCTAQELCIAICTVNGQSMMARSFLHSLKWTKEVLIIHSTQVLPSLFFSHSSFVDN